MRTLYLFSSLFLSTLSFHVGAVPLADSTEGTKYIIKSSVPEEINNSLHGKYLKFLANELGMELELTPLPFARRLDALRKGDIDLMVGLQRTEETQDEVVYLYPGYEALRHTFFVLKDENHKLKDFSDLKQLNVGVTIHAKYFERFSKENALAMIGVSTLKQKIHLLENGRIDTFLHFKESTLPTLERMKLDEKIVLADYQPNERADYYFAMSLNSPLIALKKKFEQAIRAGVETGKFAEIRQQHYLKEH